MSEKNINHPYKPLGLRLKKLREKSKESVAEVSGAVEIEADLLQKIENGEKRPSEDILMLLMSHFNMSEDDSTNLWEMAGYTREHLHDMPGHIHDEPTDAKPSLVMVVQSDNRVMYTDMAQVSANNYGLVLNFMQAAGQTQPMPIARIGMSREHAQSLLGLLQTTLAQMDQPPKLLPAPKEKPKPDA